MAPPPPEEILLRIASSAMRPDMDHVKQLLPTINHIDTADQQGYTALHWAASWGHLKLAQALIKAGADINARTKQNHLPCELTAIHSQITSDRPALFNILLQCGSQRPNATWDAETVFIQNVDTWFGGAEAAWQKWNREGCKPTALTPKMLVQFTSLNTINQALNPDRWHNHKDHLVRLLSCPDFPPCLLPTWLSNNPHLTLFLAGAPDPRIAHWTHEPFATTAIARH